MRQNVPPVKSGFEGRSASHPECVGDTIATRQQEACHAAIDQDTKFNGGGGGIQTPETLSGLTVFKTAGFNRSPTPPFLILAYSAIYRSTCNNLGFNCCILGVSRIFQGGGVFVTNSLHSTTVCLGCWRHKGIDGFHNP